MDRPTPVRFRFGTFEADLSTSELFEKGKKVPIQEKPFQLLAVLLQAEGNVVTRQDLSQQLWPDTHVQTDQGLNAAIRKVRVALKDDAIKPRFIETLGSRGYRFVHAFQVMRWAEAVRESSAERIRLAVLPFQNLGGIDDVIAVGATVELIAQLGRLHPRLRVLAPFSVDQFKGTHKPDFKRDLKVDLVLTGSVRRIDSGVLVTAMLTQTADGGCVWAETFERGHGELSAVQDELATQVSQVLADRFALRNQNDSRAPDATFPVYEAYLRARHFWNRRTPDSLMKSVELFESAICQDPGFALAYAGLGDTYNVIGMHGIMRPAEAFSKAAAVATRALELNPSLPEGLVALGWARACLEYDFDSSERLAQRALTINPSYAHGHTFHAFLSLAQADPDTAIDAMHRAQQLDPLSLPINAMLGNTYFYARRYSEAIDYGRKALDLDPHYPLAQAFLAVSYVGAGQPKEGTRHLRNAVAEAGREPMIMSLLAHALGVQGQHEEARNIIDELSQMTPPAGNYFLALAFMGIGEQDQVLDLLERTRDERSHWALSLHTDCRFDLLRSHPRFESVLPKSTR